MWKQQIIDLGKVKVKVPVKVGFEYVGDGRYIQSKTSCGCTLASWDSANSVLETTYTPGDVAPHLRAMGKSEYDSLKFVQVTMIENKKVVNYDLQIKAKVHE